MTDKQTEALKLALEALENAEYGDYDKKELNEAITAIREALAEQPAQQQEPVAVVSGYYGGQCVVLPTNPAILFNSGTAFYTSPLASKPEQQEEPYPVEEMQDEILRLSEIISTNAFYQAGHADALEWAAQMAVLEDPRTSDWVYDDPHDLEKALRKGPDFLSSPPASKPEQQEPVYFCDWGVGEGWGKVDANEAKAYLANGMTVEAYYTSPQSKPLTDEQKLALCKQFPNHLTFNAIEAIEAAHGIKRDA
jgi:hypothetical protein